MRSMKKFLAVLLVGCLSFALFGCSMEKQVSNVQEETTDQTNMDEEVQESVNTQTLINKEDASVFTDGTNVVLRLQGDLLDEFMQGFESGKHQSGNLSLWLCNEDESYYCIDVNFDGGYHASGYDYATEKNIDLSIDCGTSQIAIYGSENYIRTENLYNISADISFNGGDYVYGDNSPNYFNLVHEMSVQELADTKNNLAQELSEELAQKQQNDSVNEVTDEVDETASNTTSQPEEKTPDSNTTSVTMSYPFIDVIYKHENLDLTFQLKTPDADGNPTEITLNGAAYMDYTFDNQTYALSNVSITEDAGYYYIKATWYIGEQEYLLDMQDAGDNSWKMHGPGMCSGYYYPE